MAPRRVGRVAVSKCRLQFYQWLGFYLRSGLPTLSDRGGLRAVGGRNSRLTLEPFISWSHHSSPSFSTCYCLQTKCFIHPGMSLNRIVDPVSTAGITFTNVLLIPDPRASARMPKLPSKAWGARRHVGRVLDYYASRHSIGLGMVSPFGSGAKVARAVTHQPVRTARLLLMATADISAPRLQCATGRLATQISYFAERLSGRSTLA
jgi:hypothetical protein